MGTFERLAAAALRLQADCDDLLGVVLATPEGLVLAGWGTLGSEASAAAATSLADVLDQNLSIVLGSACTDALLWTPTALWGVARLASRHVLLTQAAVACGAGTMRLMLGRLRRDLAMPLQDLAAPCGV